MSVFFTVLTCFWRYYDYSYISFFYFFNNVYYTCVCVCVFYYRQLAVECKGIIIKMCIISHSYSPLVHIRIKFISVQYAYC